jgi:purine-nucleoside phosphorylase
MPRAGTTGKRTAGGEFARVERAAKFIRAKTKLRPAVGLVLGSGLGAFADELAGAARVPYQQIPGFPRSTAVGHAGRLVIGKVGDAPVAVMQGRAHFYEGYAMRDVVFGVRVLARLGCRALVVTNAAGGINRAYKQGCLVVLRDHINLMGANPLIGPNDERFGPRFPDMTRAYSPRFRQIALEEGRRLGIEMHEGVYAALTGPSYETPAEIRAIERLGADLVGMSTVPEVIAARHIGLEVLAISCVTNLAAGILDQPLSHDEVLATGARVQQEFSGLLRALLPRLCDEH